MLTYGDGVCDVDLQRSARASTARTASSPPSPPSARPRASAAWSSTATWSPSSPRSRRSARAGSTAGSSSSSRRCSTTSTATRRAWRRDALRAPGGDGQLVAYRHDGFWQCMDTLRDKRLLESAVAERAGAVEGLGMTAASGATGRRSSPARPGSSAAGWCGACVDARRRRRLPGPRLGAARRELVRARR